MFEADCPCHNPDPTAAWRFHREMPVVRDYVAESHYSLRARRCPHCSGCFLRFFAETVDWEHGNDPAEYAAMTVFEALPDTLDLQSGLKFARAQARNPSVGLIRSSTQAEIVQSWSVGPKEVRSALSGLAFWYQHAAGYF